MAVVVPIAADYDGAGVREAQASIAKFGQSITKSLQQAGRESRKALKQIEEGADDSRTAAQRLAASIGTVADKLDTELTKSAAAADALSKALGPEFAQRVGRNGINKLVTDLNRAGVTLEDITAEADTLAASLRQLDDVNLRALGGELDTVDRKMRDVGDNTDRTRSVMANFTGNAAQEIPGVSQALGPLNTAIGQFAEYAAEGNIRLRSLVAAFGPLAAASVALAVVQEGVQNTAETAQFAKDNVDALTKSLLQNESVTAALRDRYEELGGAQIRVFDDSLVNNSKRVWQNISLAGQALRLFGIEVGKQKTKDITEDLVALGLTADDVAKIIAGGPDTIARFTESLRALGLETVNASNIERFFSEQLKVTNDAQEIANVKRQFALGITQQTAAATDLLTQGMLAAKQVQDDLAGAALRAAEGIDAARLAFYKQVDAGFAAEDSYSRAAAAVDKAAKAEETARKTNKPEDIRKAVEARDEAARAATEASTAAGIYAETMNGVDDAETDAKDSALGAAGAFSELAKRVGPGSAVYSQLTAYYEILLKIAQVQGFDTPTVRTPSTGVPLPQLTTSAAPIGNITNVYVTGQVVDPVGLQNTLTRLATNQEQRLGV